MRHLFGPHEAVEIGARDKSQLHGFLAQRRAVGVRGLRYLGGVVVADVRRQWSLPYIVQ